MSLHNMQSSPCPKWAQSANLFQVRFPLCLNNVLPEGLYVVLRLSTPGLLRCCPCRLRRTRLTKQGTEEPQSSFYRVPQQHEKYTIRDLVQMSQGPYLHDFQVFLETLDALPLVCITRKYCSSAKLANSLILNKPLPCAECGRHLSRAQGRI